MGATLSIREWLDGVASGRLRPRLAAYLDVPTGVEVLLGLARRFDPGAAGSDVWSAMRAAAARRIAWETGVLDPPPLPPLEVSADFRLVAPDGTVFHGPAACDADRGLAVVVCGPRPTAVEGVWHFTTTDGWTDAITVRRRPGGLPYARTGHGEHDLSWRDLPDRLVESLVRDRPSVPYGRLAIALAAIWAVLDRPTAIHGRLVASLACDRSYRAPVTLDVTALADADEALSEVRDCPVRQVIATGLRLQLRRRSRRPWRRIDFRANLFGREIERRLRPLDGWQAAPFAGRRMPALVDDLGNDAESRGLLARALLRRLRFPSGSPRTLRGPWLTPTFLSAPEAYLRAGADDHGRPAVLLVLAERDPTAWATSGRHPDRLLTTVALLAESTVARVRAGEVVRITTADATVFWSAAGTLVRTDDDIVEIRGATDPARVLAMLRAFAPDRDEVRAPAVAPELLRVFGLRPLAGDPSVWGDPFAASPRTRGIRVAVPDVVLRDAIEGIRR